MIFTRNQSGGSSPVVTRVCQHASSIQMPRRNSVFPPYDWCQTGAHRTKVNTSPDSGYRRVLSKTKFEFCDANLKKAMDSQRNTSPYSDVIRIGDTLSTFWQLVSGGGASDHVGNFQRNPRPLLIGCYRPAKSPFTPNFHILFRKRKLCRLPFYLL